MGVLYVGGCGGQRRRGHGMGSGRQLGGEDGAGKAGVVVVAHIVDMARAALDRGCLRRERKSGNDRREERRGVHDGVVRW